MAGADVVRLSAASYVEAAICVERKADPVRRALLNAYIANFGIRIEPVTAEQTMLARQAFVLFGRGRHKASLNFGDCFTYALAKRFGNLCFIKAGILG